MSNWRFSGGMLAFIPRDGKKKVYVASSDKKSYQTPVIKLIDWNNYETVSIPDCKVDAVRFVKDLEKKLSLGLEVKSKHFPNPGEWYALENFDINTVSEIITQASGSNLGEYEQDFEISFCSTDPTKVTVITEGMDLYKECMSETARRLSCDFGTKTRKWKPGHKYETETQTYIYLGTFSSRKSNNTRSEFLTDTLVTDAKLYVTELLPGEKTVEDVLMNRGFDSLGGEGIKILYGTKTGVDAGEVLQENPGLKYEDCIEKLFENTCKKFKSQTTFGRETFTGIKDILDIFSLQSPGTYEYPSAVQEMVESVLKIWGWNVLISYWDSDNNTYHNIGPKESREKNEESLKFLLSFTIRDENLESTSYYIELFSRIGVDFKKLCGELLGSWENTLNLITTDFDVYTKNLDYTENKRVSLYINLKTYSSHSRNDSPVTIGKYLESNSEQLTSILAGISNCARQNYGAGVEEFQIFNVGTIRNPRSYNRITISLKNIIDFANSEMKLTDTLKNEIMTNSISRVIIEADTENSIE